MQQKLGLKRIIVYISWYFCFIDVKTIALNAMTKYNSYHLRNYKAYELTSVIENLI